MLLKLVAEGCFSAIAASFNPMLKCAQSDQITNSLRVVAAHATSGNK